MVLTEIHLLCATNKHYTFEIQKPTCKELSKMNKMWKKQVNAKQIEHKCNMHLEEIKYEYM